MGYSSRMEKGLALLRKYRRRSEAECAAALLRSCGIPSFVFREDAGGYVPDLVGVLPQFDARLMVPEERIEEARAILDAQPDSSQKKGTDTDG